MSSGSSDLTELTGTVVAKTGLAVLINVEEREAWLPFSQIEVEGECVVGKEITVTLPQWLAERKGLV